MERVRRVLPFDFLRLGSILVPRQILPPKYVASKARNRSTASVCVNDTKAVYYVGVRAGEQGRRSWMDVQYQGNAELEEAREWFSGLNGY